jgi:biopolymer transport protein ExbD
MALKRQQEILSGFSMASMTDIIFLLLVFFLVTSNFVFPTALDINLPEGSEQTSLKPATRVFIDGDGAYFVSHDEEDLVPVSRDSLAIVLNSFNETDSVASAIAVYADVDVAYGKVVEVLNLGAQNSLKMVLATKPTTNHDQQSQQPTADDQTAAPVETEVINNEL